MNDIEYLKLMFSVLFAPSIILQKRFKMILQDTQAKNGRRI